ncbi:MAG: hypothetical protein ACTIC1_17215, partial [Brevibacterium sp.]
MCIRLSRTRGFIEHRLGGDSDIGEVVEVIVRGGGRSRRSARGRTASTALLSSTAPLSRGGLLGGTV